MDKNRAKIYFDFLTPDQIEGLKAELDAGPQPATRGVHPDADEATRLRIGAKMFNDKFHRDPFEPDPHFQNVYYDDLLYDHRTIAERLKEDHSDDTLTPPISSPIVDNA